MAKECCRQDDPTHYKNCEVAEKEAIILARELVLEATKELARAEYICASVSWTSTADLIKRERRSLEKYALEILSGYSFE